MIDLSTDANLLVRTWSLTTALRGTTSRTTKIDLLTNAIADPDMGGIVTWLLRQLYEPLINHNVTSKTASKFTDWKDPEWREKCERFLTETHRLTPAGMPLLVRILKKLSERSWSGHKALAFWNFYRSQFKQPELQSTLDLILDRDLKVGVAVKSVNEALRANKRPPISEFSVALGESATKAKVPNLTGGQWFASRKLDGVRCIAIRTENAVTLYARSGIRLENFKHIEEAVEAIPPKIFKPYLIQGGMVLDGELALDTEDGEDDFAGLMKLLRKKAKQVPNASLHCFDVMSLQTFKTGSSKSAWDARQFQLRRLIRACGESVLRYVQQTHVDSPEKLSKMVDEALAMDHEGIILRRNTTYVGKRSHDIIKYKKLESCEMTVDRLVTGRMSIKHGDQLVEVPIMSSAVCIHDRGFEVKVGSGWSVDERRYYFENPEQLIGKVITVEYMQETKDSKTGQPSLRFPIFKVLHGKKRKL